MDKAFILSEIRRCAAENDGVPLGRERFYAATGIREADWSGRYWVRWNDALVEAGFPPNRLNPAHTEDHLLRQLALVVRELGHFPVVAELKMHRLRDPQFPNFKTYFNRFGGKQATIARLVSFCSSEADLRDVAEICEPLLASAPDTDKAEGSGDTPTGFVYLVKSGKYYKIGRSNSTGRRTYEFDRQLPDAPHLVHEIATDDPVGIEQYWQDRFREQQHRREWFKLSADDVKAFKRRRFM